MYKFLFEILIQPLGIFQNPLLDWLVLSIVGTVAFQIAWAVSPGGVWGSEIHWFTRVIAFVVIWAIIKGVLWVYNMIIALPLMFWIMILTILLCIISFILLYRYQSNLKENLGELK